MASLIIISWRAIPAQVVVKRGRAAAKVQLSQRFHRAIDRAHGVDLATPPSQRTVS
jgi:hypothetical protein